MATNHTTSALVENAMQQFTEKCRKAGLKITHQRSETYKLLLQVPDHPTAETLHKRLQVSLPSLSLDTVYRTLATLEECNLVRRIQTAESQARFEAVCEQHHHLICNQCKRVVDFTWHEVDTLTVPSLVTDWGAIETKNMVIYGTCAACLRTTEETTAISQVHTCT